MNAWHSLVQKQGKPMVEVPLASTYLAARGLADTAEAQRLGAPLLQHLRSVLATCPTPSDSALGVLESARHAALPLERDELDCLFAAAALAGDEASNRIFCTEDAPLGLGHVDLGRKRYVATLADCHPEDLPKKMPFLPTGAHEHLQPALALAQESFCGLQVHDDSPSLFAVQFEECWLEALLPAFDAADESAVQCCVYGRSGQADTAPLKLHSEKKLELQRLSGGALALAKARPEWLLEVHALSLQEAWVHLECSAFRMLCRLPDISATSARTRAVGFLPQEWFARTLGIPETCSAYLPPGLVAALAQRFPWFAPTAPLLWLESASKAAAPSATL